jgi:hypothetical protein
MKNLETLPREETREPVKPVFNSIASATTTQTVEEPEPSSRYLPFPDTFVGREAYRLSPLSEW